MSDLALILGTGYTIAAFGTISSIISIWTIYKLQPLHNAFGFLCALQSLIEGTNMFFMVFLSFSYSLLNPESSTSFILIFNGFTVTILHVAATYLQLIKSINRSCAIIFPLKYNNYFTIQKTLIYLIPTSILCFLQVAYNLFYPCHLVYNQNYFGWGYRETMECIKYIGYPIFTYGKFSILGVTLVFDGITLCYLGKFRKSVTNSNKKIMRTKIRFFYHAFLSSIFHAFVLISPRVIRLLATSNYAIFLTATANMLFFHAFNEFLFVVFTRFGAKDIKHQPSSHLSIIHHTTYTLPKMTKIVMNNFQKSHDDNQSINSNNSKKHHKNLHKPPKTQRVHINVEEIEMIDSEDAENNQSENFSNLDTTDDDQESTKFLHLNVCDILKRERSLSEMTELSETLVRRASNLSEISKIILEKENEETAKLKYWWKTLLIVIISCIAFAILFVIVYICIQWNI